MAAAIWPRLERPYGNMITRGGKEDASPTASVYPLSSSLGRHLLELPSIFQIIVVAFAVVGFLLATLNFEPDEPGCVPVQDDPRLQGYNADRRVDDLMRAAEEQAAMARTNHVLWAMGDDFTYQTAGAWFSAMDWLVHHANLDGRINMLYSTPSIYLEAVHRFQDQVPSSDWPLKTGDFFPYADDPESYWTGYFTSRAAFKGFVRALGGYLQAARQLELFKGRTANGPSTDSLEEAMATVQHHDAVTGTSTQAVIDDHAKRLYIGVEESGQVINSALEVLTGGIWSQKNRTIFEQCWLLKKILTSKLRANIGDATNNSSPPSPLAIFPVALPFFPDRRIP